MTGYDKSRGHVAFVGVWEFFKAASGDLFRAQASAPVMTDGYRCGRWEAPHFMADKAVELARRAIQY